VPFGARRGAAGYPDAVPGLRAPLIALALAVLVAACGGATPSSDATTAPTPSTQATQATGAPATEVPPTEVPPTEQPTSAPTDEPTETPAVEPTEEPSAGPTATAPAGGADACTGSDANREFLSSIARAVDWPVLCGVLPKRWFVGEGRYRTANGGWMYITYNGPGGARVGLYQGAYCATQGGCPALGADLGPAALGPFDGTLHEVADGYAVVVDPGSTPSWLLTTTGLDQATTVQLAGAAVEVGG
jgi:hypothetical protein